MEMFNIIQGTRQTRLVSIFENNTSAFWFSRRNQKANVSFSNNMRPNDIPEQGNLGVSVSPGNKGPFQASLHENSNESVDREAPS